MAVFYGAIQTAVNQDAPQAQPFTRNGSGLYDRPRSDRGVTPEKGADPCATPNLDESVIQQAFIDNAGGIFNQKETLIHAMECVVASIMETDEINDLITRLQAENDEREAELRILVRQRTSEEIVPEENLRRYEELCGPFEETRKRIKKLRNDRVHGTSRKEQINQFISSLREHDKPLAAFDADLWNAIVDHGTVHPNRIVFTLKDGTEAECEI